MSNEENSQEEAGEEFPGLRFRPTEQELLGYYLKRKSTGKLPSNPYIRVVDVYRYDPWELYQSQEEDEEMYTFVEKSETQRRVSRVTPSGGWKCLGSETRIWDSRKKLLLGHKKSLRFYVGKASKRQKTEWFMTEFLLPFSEPQNYVLCKLYKISSTYQEKVKCAEASIGSVSAVEIRESGVSEVNSYSCMKGIPSSSTAASLARSVCGEMAEISSSLVVHDHGKDLWQDWEQLFDCASAPAPGYEDGEQLFSFASAPSPGYEDGKQLFSFASAPALAPGSVSSRSPAPSSVSSGWPALACDSPSAPNSFLKK